MQAIDWYLSLYKLFKSRLNGSTKLPFHQLREQAIERFAQVGFPTTRHEEWKYTSIAPLLKHHFQLPEGIGTVTQENLKAYLWGEASQNRIVFLNGRFSAELSRWQFPEGVYLCSLQEAFTRFPEQVNAYLGRQVDFENEPFAALNTAFSNDGLFVLVQKNVVVNQPLHVLYMSLPGKQEFVVHPRNLVVLEQNAQFKLFESYVASQESTYFNNVLNEIVIGPGGHLEWIKLQDESRAAYHISWTQVVQSRDSYLSSVNMDFGARLVRNNLNVRLADQHCETHLWGVYLGDGNQLVDNHTFIDHAMPNCFSNELYKGILGGRARGVFNGKILVRRNAQKTNALQSNKTLLLTNECEIDAKPQLEIFADDVKCTHGATIGQLDENAYFYLRARGLSADTARALLRYAFLADVLENLTLEQLREKLDGLLFQRLKTMKEA